MSKLLTKPTNGYTRPKDEKSVGNYPNTLVEAVYYDEEGESLDTFLDKLESSIADSEKATNKVTTLSSSSTDEQYPSAKAVYDAIQAGGGGGGTSDVSSVIQTDGSLWNVDDSSGSYTTSKVEAAALFGVSEEIFDEIIAGNDARALSVPNETTGKKLLLRFAGYYKRTELGELTTSITYTEEINYWSVQITVSEPEGGDAGYSIVGLGDVVAG